MFTFWFTTFPVAAATGFELLWTVGSSGVANAGVTERRQTAM